MKVFPSICSIVCISPGNLCSPNNMRCYDWPLAHSTVLDRNTTLPHPEADMGPNPVIESADIVHARSHSIRSSISHKRFHHTRKSSQVTKDPMEGLYDNIQYEDGSVETDPPKVDAARGTPSQEFDDEELELRAGAEETRSVMGESNDEHHSQEDSQLTVEELRDEQGYREGERKKGVLRKLGLHKV